MKMMDYIHREGCYSGF